MCSDNVKVLSKVRSGELSFCKQCNVYHLEFNNIYIEFDQKEFEQFRSYILDLEIDYWENRYASAKVKRKIPVPSMQPNLVLMFNRQEVRELRALLTVSTKDMSNCCINIGDIDYKFILN